MQLGDGHGGSLESSLLNDSFSQRNVITEHGNQLNVSMENGYEGFQKKRR